MGPYKAELHLGAKLWISKTGSAPDKNNYQASKPRFRNI